MAFNLSDCNKPKYPILQFFGYTHLPEKLQLVSKDFHDLAHKIAKNDSDHPAEVATALRKLLEAKDAAVRACL